MDIRRVGALAGLIGPLLFAAIFTLEGWLRPGYDPSTMFVSELALGPRGWIQIANFVVYGTLCTVFAQGMMRDLGPRGASRAGLIMLWALGVALVLGGVFVMDPLGRPPPPRTLHGVLHGLAGGYVFLGWPVCLFLLARSFREIPHWRPFAPWTILAALGTTTVLGVMTAFMKVVPPATYPPAVAIGWIQRAHIDLWLVWQFAAAWRLRTAA